MLATCTRALATVYKTVVGTSKLSVPNRKVGSYQEARTDRNTFAVISLWGKFRGLHTCGATFRYIVPRPNIFLTRLFSKLRLKRKDFREIVRLTWAQEAPGSNPGAPTTSSCVFHARLRMSVRYEMNLMNCSPTSRPLSATTHNRSRLALLALTVALVSLSAATPVAQTSQQRDAITVEGTVRSSAGAPVAGASVWLEERGQGQSKAVETKTNPDGSFVFSPGRAGTYTVWAEKSGLRSRVTDSLVLSAGEKRRVDLILANAPGASMELKDEPNFTVAGVTDWSNVGLHGSDTNSRTSEALAKDTLRLKSGASEKKPAGATAGKYEPALECSAKGDFVQAREQVRNALASGDDDEGHRLLGDLDERLGDPLDAVREYERAARMYPSEQNYFDWGTELLLHKAAQPAVFVREKVAAVPTVRDGRAHVVGTCDEVRDRGESGHATCVGGGGAYGRPRKGGAGPRGRRREGDQHSRNRVAA